MQSAWWIGDYPVSQAYGCTDFAEEGPSPFHSECPYFHEGIDIAIPCDVGIKAPFGGRVMHVGFSGYGPFAIQLRVDDFDIYLGHLQAAYVRAGQDVVAGAFIGAVGSLGFSTGCHLHFEVRPAGAVYRNSVDPAPWLGASDGGPLVVPPSPPWPPLPSPPASASAWEDSMHLPAYSGNAGGGQVEIPWVNTADQRATLVISNVLLQGPLKLAAYFVDWEGNQVWGELIEVPQAQMRWWPLPADKLGRVVLQPSNLAYSYAVVYSPKP